MVSKQERERLAGLGEKFCPQCKSPQPFGNFSRSVGSRDDRAGICKGCASVNAASWSARAREKNLKRRAEMAAGIRATEAGRG